MTFLASRLFCHFVVFFDVFFRTPPSCLSLIESVFFVDTFGVSFYSSIEFISLHSLESVFFVDTFGVSFDSSIEFISLHSLFTPSFYFISHIRYTHKLYRRGAYL